MKLKISVVVGAVTAMAALGGYFLLGAGVPPASAYSGSQAEAQMDRSDPYSFPNIDFCCKEHKHRKKWRKRPGYGGGGGGYNGGHYDDRDGGRETVRVSCGAPRSHSYSSISEGLAHLKEGGRILVHADAPCDVSGLQIDQGVLIETDYESYGRPAVLRGNACINVAPHYASSAVSFRNIEIEACVVLQYGQLNYNEVNQSSYGPGDGIRMDGGTFAATDSTVRARGTAINAERGVMVSLTRGGFASAARAEQTIFMNADGANFQNTVVKGGVLGIRLGLQGRYPVSLTGVQVMRGDLSEIMQVGPGKGGIVVGGTSAGDGLPSLPSMPSATLTIDGGSVSGYADGIVFGPGTRSTVRGVVIVHPGRGIVASHGAVVDLSGNTISHSKRAGIELEAGVIGQARNNNIQCDRGECVCYGGECTSRSDKVFNALFQMSGTRCDD
ncbi:MAG: right-handed parallel beta-helix repeat-containing protein [Alphaproteobacteria bacterium]|nr:right-handed parallel beta-helix repeat-containing protein [Alphaproteobacteria bacterium]